MRRLRSRLTSGYFWVVVLMLSGLTAVHYSALPMHSFLSDVGVILTRRSVERILFLLPVVIVTSVFGRTGGLIVLGIGLSVMLPQAIWLSSHPVDAIAESIALGVVGYLVLQMGETEDVRAEDVHGKEREKSLRQEAVARMRSFNAVCSIVAKSLELEQILNEALDKVLEVTNLEVGLMYLLDSPADALVLSAHRGLSEEGLPALSRLRLGEGLCGQVARSGESTVLENPARDSCSTEPILLAEGVETQIVVPLVSKGEVHGVMALGSREQHSVTSADLQLITTFGKQIGVGVENAKLHRDVERQLQIQQRLNEVAERVTSELELDRILPKVLQIAEGLVGADCGFIALFDPATKRLSYPYLHNLPQDLTDVTVSKGEGVAGEAMVSGSPVSISDYPSYPNAVRAFVDAGLVSVVAVPIVASNRSFGTLAVGSREAKEFSPAEISTLEGVGRQAGIAIDNARLYENMRYYARQITRAQEDERKRIAREAHDETAQILVALSRQLDALSASPRLPSAAFRERLEGVRELTTDALQSVRRFSQDLRPPVLDDLGFVPAIRGLSRQLEGEAGVKTEFRVSGTAYRLSPEEELVLFRIAQESLNNIRRHADASEAKVTVSFRPNNVRMVIEDDGKGFDSPEKFVDLVASGRLGLIGMHERARIVGGTLRIDAEPGRGTRVVVDAPVHRRG